jgi:hypothetical protein
MTLQPVPSHLNFLIYEENFIFFFISVGRLSLLIEDGKTQVFPQSVWFGPYQAVDLQ